MEAEGFQIEQPFLESVSKSTSVHFLQPREQRGPQSDFNPKMIFPLRLSVQHPAMKRPLKFQTEQSNQVVEEDVPELQSLAALKSVFYKQLYFRDQHRQNNNYSIFLPLSFLQHSLTLPRLEPLADYPEEDCSEGVQFQSRFEGGNLLACYEDRRKQGQFLLVLQSDVNTHGYQQNFYFSVRRLQRGKVYRFRIINLLKKHSLFKQGMKPLFFSYMGSVRTGVGWKRTGFRISYSKSKIRRQWEQDFYYCLSFSYLNEYENDTVFVSSSIPYSYSRVTDLLTSLSAANRAIRVSQIASSIAFNSIPLVSVLQKSKNRKKKTIVIMARQHPGESVSSWVMEGVLQFLAGTSVQSHLFKQIYNFRILPMVCVDGVIAGNFRCDISGVDLNRQWPEPSKAFTPGIYAIKKLLMQLIQDDELQFVIDLHGHSKKMGSFAYCCRSGVYQQGRVKQLPYLLSKGNPVFDFSQCTWGVQMSKRSTARAVISGSMVSHKFITQEFSFYGYDSEGLRKHFTIKELNSQGKRLMASLCTMLCSEPLFLQQLNEEVEQFCRSVVRKNKQQNDSGSQSQPDRYLLEYEQIKDLLNLEPWKIGYRPPLREFIAQPKDNFQFQSPFSSSQQKNSTVLQEHTTSRAQPFYQTVQPVHETPIVKVGWTLKTTQKAADSIHVRNFPFRSQELGRKTQLDYQARTLNSKVTFTSKGSLLSKMHTVKGPSCFDIKERVQQMVQNNLTRSLKRFRIGPSISLSSKPKAINQANSISESRLEGKLQSHLVRRSRFVQGKNDRKSYQRVGQPTIRIE